MRRAPERDIVTSGAFIHRASVSPSIVTHARAHLSSLTVTVCISHRVMR